MLNERIKELRKYLELNQKDFAQKIGLGGTSITHFEKGTRNPSEQTILSICREFNVNENWLRNGEGEIFNTFSEDERYAVNVGRLQRTDDETIMRWVNAIAETDPKSLKEIEFFLKKVLDIQN